MKPFKCVVPVSGGKDSQACLKLALKEFETDEILGLFCDTRFEHPLTYSHIDRIRELYGVEVRTVCTGNVEDLVVKYGRFPGNTVRFCTDQLKIIPSKVFYRALAVEQGSGFQVWLGIRANESRERAKRYSLVADEDTYPPHEISEKMYPKRMHKLGISFRFPIMSWATSEVIDFLNGEENPLYSQGFDRVGCFPCLAAGDKTKIQSFEFGEFGAEQRKKVAVLECKTGESVFRYQVGQRYEAQEKAKNDADQGGAGCSFCSI